MCDEPLKNRTIAVPETRELAALSQLLVAEGALVFACPLVAILDSPNQSAVSAWIERLADGEFDDVIIYTGEGINRLVAAAERMNRRDAMIAGLARARKITRGPKPARGLADLGLRPDLAPKTPTTAGLISLLSGEAMAGRRVAVQLYGGEPNAPLMEFLRAAGATPIPVAPYVYAPASDTQRVVVLIDRLIAGSIDAMVFTSTTQVDRLFEVARETGRAAQLLHAAANLRVAAVGPVVAASLAEQGMRVDITPPRNFFLKPLVAAIRNAFAHPDGRSGSAA